MTHWYLYEEGEVLGPFDPVELRDRLSVRTLVCREGEKEWQKAGEIEELRNALNTGVSSSRSSQGEEPVRRESDYTRRKERREKEKSDSSKTSDESKQLNSIEPTLGNLVEICERAKGQDLLREYHSFWNKYDQREQQIISRELQRRGLLEES